MSLINYVEPVDPSGLLFGLGFLCICLLICYIFYRIFKPMINFLDNAYNKEIKYSVVEEKMLDDVAKEKGIDLNGELLKRDVLRKPNKSFRKKMEEEMFKKMFDDEEVDKKK